MEEKKACAIITVMKGKSIGLDKAIRFSRGGIVSKVIARRGRVEMTLFCMAKGTALSEHASSREAHILVLKGKGVFTLEGRPVRMAPGVLISMKSRTRHALKATGNLAFLLALA